MSDRDQTSVSENPDGRRDEFGLTAEEHAEMDALLASFDARLIVAEKRIDRVLARLGIE